MAKYRSELKIPVEVDQRSFSDIHRERFHTDRYSPTLSKHSPNTPSDTDRYSPSNPWYCHFSGGSTNSCDSDNWFDEMRQRLDNRRKKWDEDVRKMRQDFFKLSPETSRRSLSPPRLIIPQSKFIKPFSGDVEPTADGSTYFTANFELTEFKPEDIRVAVRNNQVFVSAKTEHITEKGKSSREYTRSVKLPEGADESLADASLSADGILTFSCPMRPLSIAHKLSSLGSDEHIIDSPDSRHSIGLTPSSSHRQRRRSSDFTLYHYSPNLNISKSTKFRLELPIGSDYLPSEIHIRTLNHRIYVSARHEERQPNRTAVKEFSKEYDIPDNVDPECLEARLENGILCIEAV